MAGAYETVKSRSIRGELVILDGGIGTEIVRRGKRWRQHGMRTDADTVRSVHQDYVKAGADVITTNTFQLTRRTSRLAPTVTSAAMIPQVGSLSFIRNSSAQKRGHLNGMQKRPRNGAAWEQPPSAAAAKRLRTISPH
jgi:S-methylmethionine-dependent homocysteine/selenocysteine methylase